MDTREIISIREHFSNYCPRYQDTANPTIMAVIETQLQTFYIISYDRYDTRMDAVVYDEDDRKTNRREVFLYDLYDLNPKLNKMDTYIGLKLTELYSCLGWAYTYGDWTNTRNIENAQQLHIALKLIVAYEQITDEHICQAHIRTIDRSKEWLIYSYHQNKKYFKCMEIDRKNKTIKRKQKHTIKYFMKSNSWIEIVTRESKYIGLSLDKIERMIKNELQ